MLSRITPTLFLILLSCALYLPGINSIPMLDRDSAHFAQASKQMLQQDNYFQVRFQERTRFQKPPGINWLQALFVKTFSHKDDTKVWPYRLPSFFGGMLAVLLTFAFANRFINQKTALLAASLLAVSLLLVFESHLAVIDASLLSAVVLMQGALWVIYSQYKKGLTAHWGYAFCFWAAMSYGFALKGVTPLVGLLTLLSLLIVERNFKFLKHLRFSLGVILLGLNLIWLVQLNQEEGTNYLLKMVQKDLLPKLKGGHESHGQPPLFHLAILPLTLWPSSLFLWSMVLRAWQCRKQMVETFLLCWILPTWIFFELMPTKLPQYVLPTFPALSILIALSTMEFNQLKISAKHFKVFQLAAILWGIFSIAIGLTLALVPYYLKTPLPLISALLFTAVTFFSISSVYLLLKKQYVRSACFLVAGGVLTFALLFQGLLPNLKPLWLTKQIARTIEKQPLRLSREKPLLVIGFNEPSLVFYLNTHNVRFTYLEAGLQQLKNAKPRLILIDSKNAKSLKLKAKNLRLALNPIKRFYGFNYSKGQWISLELYQTGNSNDLR